MYSRERKTEAEAYTHKDRDRQTDRQTDRQAGRQADRQRQTETERDQHVSLTYWSFHILRLWIADVNV